MSSTKQDNTPQEKTGATQAPGQGNDFFAPLESSSHGRLVFDSGVNGLTLRAGAEPDALLQARFVRHVPHVSYSDGIVSVRYKRLPLFEQLFNWRPSPADFRLNDAVPWELEFRGGVSQLNADLSKLDLRSLDVLSGASRIRLTLPAPTKTTFIYITGGISQGTISVPSETGVRLQIGGGASGLTFSEQRFGAIGGEITLHTANYDSTVSRYDIGITGGVSHLKIDTISKEVSL